MKQLSNHASSLVNSKTLELFEHHFASSPKWIAAAPGRVNLIGEHIDYNGGLVLPMAVERYTIAVAGIESKAPKASDRLCVFSVQQQELVTRNSDQHFPREDHHWSDYVIGVAAGFRRRGYRIPSLNLLIDSSLPVGSGLSSSAALTVAVASAIEAALQVQLDPWEKTRLCQIAEHEFAGVPCGIMDPCTSIFAQPDQFVSIDCHLNSVHLVPFADHDVSVLIVDSGVRHALAGGEYRRRKEQCREVCRRLQIPTLRQLTQEGLERDRDRLDDRHFRTARHVVSEMQRSKEFLAAVQRHDWQRAGEIMDASHQSLRDDYKVSCNELDSLVHILRSDGCAHGTYGARMTGGGFGGCVVALAQSSAVSAICAHVAEKYHQTTSKEAKPFVTRPAAGAHWIEIAN